MSYVYTVWLAIAGLLLGHGLVGMSVGAIIGFVLDNLRYSQRRTAIPEAGGYIGPLFVVLGAIAKSDGRVSEAEIAIVERIMMRMGLTGAARQQAIEAFNRGKQPECDLSGSILALRQWAGLRRDHAFSLLDIVIETGLAEGSPSAEKMAILRQLALALRISDMELMALLAMKGYAWQGAAGARGRAYGTGGYVPPRRNTQGPDPYAVLGIARGADERAVKRAYRKLISEHHPDRLGHLPEEMRKRVQARASEINAAYEWIKVERGFK